MYIIEQHWFICFHINTILDCNEFISVFSFSDVSGGYSPSILDAIRNALSVSIHVSFGKGDDYKPLTYQEAFYLATLGGAEGKIPPLSIYSYTEGPT